MVTQRTEPLQLVATAGLLEEAAALSDAAYANSTSQAVERGWQALTIAQLGPVTQFAGGIQESTVGTEGGTKFTSAAHVYLGEVEGQRTAALAIRGVDQGEDGEWLFATAELKEYAEEHATLMAAFLRFARQGLEAGSIDQVLITGHSLGGSVATELATDLLRDPLLRAHSTVVTFGSPGSLEAVPDGLKVVNLVHTDDAIAALPNYIDNIPGLLDRVIPDDLDDTLDELDRGGTDVDIDRPEGQSLQQGDVDQFFKDLFQGVDVTDRYFLAEHDLDLYIASAAALDDHAALAASNPSEVPLTPASRVFVGTDDDDAFTANEASLLIGLGGADNLVGSAEADVLVGGLDFDRLSGGAATDSAGFTREAASYEVVGYGGVTYVIDRAGTEAADRLTGIEELRFADLRTGLPAESFDALGYVASHDDLIEAFGANGPAGFDHYGRYGFYEGRQVTFNAEQYLDNYADLRDAFGDDREAAKAHYITYGDEEGRTDEPLIASGETDFLV